MQRLKILFSILCLGTCGLEACPHHASTASSANHLSPQRADASYFVRDGHIEYILGRFLTPIFQAAGLNPTTMRPIFKVDHSYNAFATLNNVVAAHSAFILQSKTPEEMLAVLGHETGHIAGGHLFTRVDKVQPKIIAVSMISLLAGMGISMLTSGKNFDPRIGVGLGMMGAGLAAQAGLSFNRAQEQSADQAGMMYLQKLGWPLDGFLGAFKYMKQLMSNNVEYGQINPYLMTHPMSDDRLTFSQSFIAQHPKKGVLPPDFKLMFDLLQARVEHLSMNADEGLKAYTQDDRSPKAAYARALYALKSGDAPSGLTHLAPMLRDPVLLSQRPFLYELEGVLYLRMNELGKAKASYDQALALLPNHPLLLAGRANVLIHMGQFDAALLDIDTAAEKDPLLSLVGGPTWGLMARAYDGKDDKGMVSYAQGEEALQNEKFDVAERYARSAIEQLTSSSNKIGLQKAQDLMNRIDQKRSKHP